VVDDDAREGGVAYFWRRHAGGLVCAFDRQHRVSFSSVRVSRSSTRRRTSRCRTGKGSRCWWPGQWYTINWQ
jgi:hypothetical protein